MSRETTATNGTDHAREAPGCSGHEVATVGSPGRASPGVLGPPRGRALTGRAYRRPYADCARLLAAGLAVAFGLTVAAVELRTPVAVPWASGPAFPLGRDNTQPSDPQYAAGKAIDHDPATFCCLLDDTAGGPATATIPRGAVPPVTGHMVFDLGEPLLVLGVRLTGRKDAGGLNPKLVDVFHFADDAPAGHALADDLEHDAGIRPLVAGRTLPALAPGAAESVFWDGVVARYVGLRVNDSYESGGGGIHFNFQLAEVEFVVAPKPAALAPGERAPAVYQRAATLAETLLASRTRYAAVYGTAGAAVADPRLALPDPTAGIWDQLRTDFPAADHGLLEYLTADWFGERGWFGQSDRTELERALVRRAADGSGAAGAALRTPLQALEQAKAAPADPRWLGLCADAAAFAGVLRQVTSLRLAIEDLAGTYGQRYPGAAFLARLGEVREQAVAAIGRRPSLLGDEGKQARQTLATLGREALVTANPMLSPGRLLFVKRYTYTPGWYYAEFMRASHFGGGLCVLSLPDGRVTELAPELAGGIVDRYDLSFDGRHVVFGYKSAPGKGFRLWEGGTDGRGLRQVTVDPPDEQQRVATYWHPAYKPSGVYRHHTDDFHPCYLPDGGIAFASTRCEYGVLCDQSDSLAVNLLHRVEADGSGLRRLSNGALSESTPSVANDGRILYTRWEYVDKGVIAAQALWAMRPDGSGSAEVYGNDIELPPVLIHGRAVPGLDHLFVCTATMHHPFAVGPILLVDARRDVRTLEPIRSLTPDTGLSVEGKDGRPHAEDYAHLRNGLWVKDNRGPLFSEPYPLSDPETGAGAGRYFLVDANPDRPWGDPAAYGLYLIDVFGNRVPIYRDPAISCWQPLPLRPRRRPPVVPALGSVAAADVGSGEAELLLADVYAGLEGVPRGTIRYLRVLEQVPRPWAARRFWPNDSAFGQHAVVGLNSHIHVKVHHGIVPVREDGSARFVVPAGRNLFVQALDADLMEVQRMRSFVNLEPGEVRSCVGCHLYRRSAPGNRPLAAAREPPRRLQPQPGETVPRPIHFPTDVQPILDRHCISCHSPKRSDGGLDLAGEMTEYFSKSYENLMNRKLVACIQEFYGPQPDAQVTNVAPVPPKTIGSHASRLVTLLRKGHYDVRLSPAEYARLLTWVDANGPYYGTYFGPRNWAYADRPDFRLTPTLESALGRPPPAR